MAEVKVSALTALTGANVANGDELYIVDTGSPNVSKKITADELAQMPQLSSRYVSKTDEEYRWIPATAFFATNNTPALGVITDPSSFQFGHALLFDAALFEVAASSLIIPDYWSTMTMSIYWANTGTSSGDVFIGGGVRYAGTGEFPDDAQTSGFSAVESAPTTKGIIKITTSSALNVTSPGEITFARIFRIGSDGSDTLAADIAVYGLLLTRAS